MRQALAGMLWGKQYFHYDLSTWLQEHRVGPARRRGCAAGAERRVVPHDQRRHHLHAGQVGIPLVRGVGSGVPHAPLAMVDVDFAKSQLDLMLRNDYLHPNGQMPAYEWNFGDVNPPVHAYATMQVYLIDRSGTAGRATSSS
jgi:hypothetical protein